MPVTLDHEDAQYATWVELFQIHACAYNVLDHIDEKVKRPKDIDDETWKRLDVLVKQWIYTTISKDLVNTIMKPGATAQELWSRLEELVTRVQCRSVSDDPVDKNVCLLLMLAEGPGSDMGSTVIGLLLKLARDK
ncbi:uncharacterized protein LOC110689945 [Chenopodium quinoa]|uniref:uncharacterized protein LOC110689945 n=1 Tax=Chenopodium quinoa TaxID=63459 RepID=UPI000B76D671|nr:uncharacterized protein LOC110689945 [Chenopodium quinoa]